MTNDLNHVDIISATSVTSFVVHGKKKDILLVCKKKTFAGEILRSTYMLA